MRKFWCSVHGHYHGPPYCTAQNLSKLTIYVNGEHFVQYAGPIIELSNEGDAIYLSADSVHSITIPDSEEDSITVPELEPDTWYSFEMQFETEPPIPKRIPLEEVYMRMAETLAKRATCSRLQVGCVLTDIEMKSVLSVGYNGNCHGFPNRCDSDEPGACGCVHSETNALVKAPGSVEKIAFITDSPCVMCGKLLVQSNVKTVYYRRKYRLPAGLDVLEQAGIPAIHYNQWEDEWR